MTSRYTAAAISLFLWAVTAAAQLAPEIPAAMPRYQARQSTYVHRIASDGDRFYAVWWDNVGPLIYGAMIDGDGTPAAAFPTRLSTAELPPTSGFLSVVRLAGHYVVLFGSSNATVLIRVDDSGSVVERRSVPHLATTAAATGSTLLLANNLELVVLDDRLEVIGKTPHVTDMSLVAAAATPTGFLVVGVAGAGGYLDYSMLEPSGRQIGWQRQIGSGAYGTLQASSNGTAYLVVESGALRVAAHTVSAAGDIGPPRALPRHIYRSLAWSGDGYLLSTTVAGVGELEHGATVWVSSDASSVQPPLPLAVEGGGIPGVGWNGRSTLMLFNRQDSATGETGAAAVAATPQGMPASKPLWLTRPATPQYKPSMAAGALHDLVAWTENDGIFAARITADGRSLDGMGILVEAGSKPVSRLTTVFDGERYVVVWLDGTSIRARSVDPLTGETGSPFTLAIAPSQTFGLAVAEGEGGALLAIAHQDRLVLQRFDGLGRRGDAITGLETPGFSETLRVIGRRDGWFVTWANRLCVLSVMRLTRALARDGEVREVPVSYCAYRIALATDGISLLVADGHIGAAARRLGADGEVGADLKLGKEARVTSAAWTGSGYAIGLLVPDGSLHALHVAEIDGQGLAVRRDLGIVTGQDLHSVDLTLAKAPNRPLRIVYTRMADELPWGGAQRVFFRDALESRRRAVTAR